MLSAGVSLPEKMGWGAGNSRKAVPFMHVGLRDGIRRNTWLGFYGRRREAPVIVARRRHLGAARADGQQIGVPEPF